nr:DNA-primase RepB domain-containing protein [Malikia spinosa]
MREAKTGQTMHRAWSRADLVQSAAWLKRMNAQGHDVYIRPAGEHGLVLVDDLKPQALERMKAAGFAPAATLETSPGHYQAWVKLADQPLSDEVRLMAAQGLAEQYGGDLNRADPHRYGRLAGFTNQKPEHTRDDGRQPYVLAHDCPGQVATAAPAYLERIEQALEAAERAHRQERQAQRGRERDGPGRGR